jgi:hypothetical protein
MGQGILTAIYPYIISKVVGPVGFDIIDIVGTVRLKMGLTSTNNGGSSLVEYQANIKSGRFK